jgi:FAD/FMN-containing dehydrogenase
MAPADLVFVGFAQVKILGACRTPFAVKGGGHSTNPGFSSTPGVEIALSRFNSTKVNGYDGTVEIGPGLTWDQVYETLGPTGVSVVGGRIPGVGVAGLTLGGGRPSLMVRWLITSDPYRILVSVESIRTRY